MDALNTKLSLLSLLILSMILASIPAFAMAETPVITRIQGYAHATTTSNTLTVTLDQTPQDGNVIIAVLGVQITGSDTPQMFPQISQTGVTWPNCASAMTSSGSSSFNTIQVLAGIVNSSTASKTITFNLTPYQGTATATKATVDVCEYSGLDTAYILSHFTDGFSGNTGTSNRPDTDITDQTTHTNELWIGGTMLNTYAQTSANNGFALMDGQVNNGFSVAYLENIVSATGQAQATIAATGSARWYAVLAAFPAAPTITLTPQASPKGTTITMTGSGFTVNSPITATFNTTPLALNGTITSDANGNFAATFTVPALTPGQYNITATDNQMMSASADLMVVPSFEAPEGPLAALGTLAACGAALFIFLKVKKRKA